MKRLIARILTIFILTASLPAMAQEYQYRRPEPAPDFIIEAPKVANVLIVKSERKLYLLDDQDTILRTYPIGLGPSPVGDKLAEGDGKTPEGRYTIDFRNPDSEYLLSLRISYPNADDIKESKKAGVKPGGAIFIHGEPPDRSWMFWHYSNKKDWTHGCIAVNNSDIKEIWNMVPKGTPVIIEP